jgi:hypothetical protein
LQQRELAAQQQAQSPISWKHKAKITKQMSKKKKSTYSFLFGTIMTQLYKYNATA